MIFTVIGCSKAEDAVRDIQGQLLVGPYGLRIEFDGLTHNLCWEYDPQITPVYEVFHFPDREQDGVLLAQVTFGTIKREAKRPLAGRLVPTLAP